MVLPHNSKAPPGGATNTGSGGFTRRYQLQMQVNRTVHTSAFVVIPNAIAQHPTMSLAARGLLLMLLSLPTGFQINVRDISAVIPGLGKRGAGKALDELERLGFYIRTTTRDRFGRIRTATAVYDTPQTGSCIPGTGEPGNGMTGTNPVKNPIKETTPLPTLTERLGDGEDLTAITALAAEGREGGGGISTETTPNDSNDVNGDEHQGDDDTDPDGPDDDGPKGGKPVDGGSTVEGVTSLLGRIRQASGDRIAVPVRDAGKVLPLVKSWLAVGASERQIIDAVTAGLPSEIRSATGFVVSRLRDRMPAPVTVAAPVPTSAPMGECAECRNPLRGGGVCADCRTAGPANPKSIDDGDDPAVRGAAEARRLLAALRSAA